MSDASIAAIGRELAIALTRWAYSRQPEDQQVITMLHTELCREVKREADENKAREQPDDPPAGS